MGLLTYFNSIDQINQQKKLYKMSASFLDMVQQAIPAIKDRKGASRAAIANWIQKNYNKEAGGRFNSNLRTALQKGVDSGMLEKGPTGQRYKMIKKAPAPKKKSTPKKKTGSKKKASKKKKGSKKKTSSKKKTQKKKKKKKKHHKKKKKKKKKS